MFPSEMFCWKGAIRCSGTAQALLCVWIWFGNVPFSFPAGGGIRSLNPISAYHSLVTFYFLLRCFVFGYFSYFLMCIQISWILTSQCIKIKDSAQIFLYWINIGNLYTPRKPFYLGIQKIFVKSIIWAFMISSAIKIVLHHLKEMK